jgi:hypothetical protein
MKSRVSESSKIEGSGIKILTNKIRKNTMAEAHGFMKEMSGVLGDVSIMHIGKKTFIRRRPKKSKKPPTELALAKRAKFGLGGKIAGTISSIYEIKQLWKGDPEKNQSGYNKIFQANHDQLNIEDLTGKIVLSEGGGLEVLNASLELGHSGVQIDCDSFERRVNETREATKKIKAAGIIVLINPIAGDPFPKYQLMTFETETVTMEKGGKFSTRVTYKGGDLVKFQAYGLKKAFGVFVTMDGMYNPIDISETIESKLFRGFYNG